VSYAGLGQLPTGGFTISPTAITAPNADVVWRTAFKNQAIALANRAAAMSAAEKNAGGAALDTLIRSLVSYAIQASSKTKDQMAFMVAFLKVPTIYDKPTFWDTAGVRALRDGLANLKKIFATPPPPAPGAPPPSMMMTLIAPVPVTKPLVTTPLITTAPMMTITPTPYVPAAPPATPEISYMPDTPVVTTPPVVPGGMITDVPTWDTSAMTPTPAVPVALPAPAGLLGVSWKVWGIGAVAVVGVYAASRVLKANRRRVRRNRRRR
jgi:hypothetical protein